MGAREYIREIEDAEEVWDSPTLDAPSRIHAYSDIVRELRSMKLSDHASVLDFTGRIQYLNRGAVRLDPSLRLPEGFLVQIFLIGLSPEYSDFKVMINLTTDLVATPGRPALTMELALAQAMQYEKTINGQTTSACLFKSATAQGFPRGAPTPPRTSGSGSGSKKTYSQCSSLERSANKYCRKHPHSQTDYHRKRKPGLEAQLESINKRIALCKSSSMNNRVG